MNLTATRFRVLNYCNIDDSGWIPLECVTAFVGRNESGKTALLRALYKFNPAVTESYNAQLEFPRDRFTSEFDAAENWPACKVEFNLSDNLRKKIREKLAIEETPRKAILTRYYDGHLTFHYDTNIPKCPLNPNELLDVFDSFIGGVRNTVDLSLEIKDYLTGWANNVRKVRIR